MPRNTGKSSLNKPPKRSGGPPHGGLIGPGIYESINQWIMNRLTLTLTLLLLFYIPFLSAAPGGEQINVVIFGSHPDDADKQAGGTALEFIKRGHNVVFVSLTNGDAGHQTLGGKELADRRFLEAREAGRRFGVEYIVMDNPDGWLLPTPDIRKEVIRIIRRYNADIVIGHRTSALHPDRRNSAILLQDAAYMVIVPNIVPDEPPLKKNPLFLYFEDNFKKPNPFSPDIVVDITCSFDRKIYGMAAHETQFFQWQPWLAGRLQEVPETEEEKLRWLAGMSQSPMNGKKYESLVKWYGPQRAARVEVTESFEICEYGRQPDDTEIRRLFPMFAP
jgi:LmbE family N-acetylglucosaminyl deacetylase